VQTREMAWSGGWAPHVSDFRIKNLLPDEISYELRKIAGKFVDVGKQIWNTFNNCHFFQIFMDFELF
jgi:hypothetical protein